MTSKDVVNALVAWKQANAIAIDASRFQHVSQEELDRLWAIEEAALDNYTNVYTTFWSQGATPNGNTQNNA